MNCKVQRKHCRDHNKARQRRKSEIIKIDTPHVDDEIEEVDAPKKFGDLVTSDSIFAITRNSTSSARYGDTTALVVRDTSTGWVAVYPSKRKSAAEIMVAVNDFKGSETIKRWYSDGALELHAACRDIGIRHDISDPHRSETNGQIERTNRAVIEGARCSLYQSGMPCKYWKLAATCFALNYNMAHVDAKRGTVSYVERHSQKFKGKP
jgi:transposase InsO family protein